MERDTSFRTNGITNVMMGTLVLRLAEEGMLGLDDPISQYLDPAIIVLLNGPDGGPYGDQITLRQLLNSTSGVTGYFFAGEYFGACWGRITIDIHTNCGCFNGNLC